MKRAQITLFIIVGIVILLVIGLGVAAWKYIALERPPEEQIVNEQNLQLAPVQTYVKDCLSASTRHVLETIGLQGGYYDPKSHFIAIPGQPTNGRAFEPFPGQVLPYWSYVSSANSCLDCQVNSEQPALEGEQYPAIQGQAERAIESEFAACVGDFSGLQTPYQIHNTSSPHVELFFENASVRAHLSYTLTVQTALESVSTLRDFQSEVDIPFKRLYQYASDIRRRSDVTHFFEGLTIDTVNLESVGDPEPIPPPYGKMEITYDPGPIWTLQQTKKIVANALEQNIGYVQLLGSTDMDFVSSGDSLIDNQYANFYFSIGDPAPQAKARFLYLSSWDPYVAIHPGGQIIKPSVLSVGGVPFITPMKTKDFDYDVSYPLLIQLSAPTSKGDFLFQFPIEVNMRNNDPLDYTPLDVQEPEVSFCDPAQATGTKVTVDVKDTSGVAITDASIRYTCLANSCDLASTPVQLPNCIGGQITAEKTGYEAASAPLDSTSGSETVTLTLQKLTPVTIIPEMHYIQKETNPLTFAHTWKLTTNTFPIAAPRQLVLIITAADNPDDAQVVLAPSDESTVNLHLGNYTVTAAILETLDAPIVAKGYDECGGGVVGIGQTCTTVPDITLGDNTYTDENGKQQPIGTDKSVMYAGGLRWDETTKELTVTPEMLQHGSITIPVAAITLQDITSVKDLDAFDQVDILSKDLDAS